MLSGEVSGLGCNDECIRSCVDMVYKEAIDEIDRRTYTSNMTIWVKFIFYCLWVVTRRVAID